MEPALNEELTAVKIISERSREVSRQPTNLQFTKDILPVPSLLTEIEG